MIAQKCSKCGEVIVVKVREETCPFCDEPMPLPIKPKIKEPPKTEHKVLTEITEEPSAELIKEFVEVQNKVHLLYNLVYGFLAKNTGLIKSKEPTNEELCDFGYICREIAKIFDELRKEANARMDLCSSIIAYRLTQASLQDATIKMKVSGQFATGTPDVKMEVGLPKKLTPEYYRITDFFNVPREVAETGILKLDWKSVTKFCTELTQQGKSIPEGFGQKYPKYIVTYRKKKGN